MYKVECLIKTTTTTSITVFLVPRGGLKRAVPAISVDTSSCTEEKATPNINVAGIIY